ncbi:MAG: YfhO family protein [Mogibacterium sp.]|nr:YfhO family protein [Mogibacterium sp.]
METGKHFREGIDEIELKLNKKPGLFKQILIYTIMFLITAAGAYAFFILGKSTFLKAAAGGNKDGIAQIYPSYVAVKHLVQGLIAGQGMSGWNWSIGLGGENWNMFAAKLANPFTYLIIAAPDDKIDLSYTLVAVFKQYCAGLTFMLFGRKVGFDHRQNIMGGMCYAFSMWMFMTATAQSGFDTAAILFPLLVLGAEKIIENESPLLFILTVFFFLTSGVVWGYAAGIMIVIYYFVRSIISGKLRDFPHFGKTTGLYILSGIAGILIAAAFVAEILLSMTSATTDTGSGKQAWFTLRQYIGVPIALYKAAQTGAPSYSAIGLPIIGVMMMPLMIPGIFKKKPQAFMAVACLVGTQIPAVCRLFNGLSYPSGRWFFMVAFFVTWAAIENLTMDTFRSVWKCLVMELWVLLTAGWVIYTYIPMGMSGKKTAFTAACGILFATFIVIVGHIKAREEYKESQGLPLSSGFAGLIRKSAVLLIALAVMADIVEIETIGSFTRAMDGVPGYSHVGEAYSGIMATPETAVPEIQAADPDFYRSDQVDGYYGIRTSGAKVNENIMFNTRSVYTCFSSAPSAWHEYNKAVGNAAGNYRRTLIASNDNRAMLDYLTGVKYFVGKSENDTKKNHASLYVPFGYERVEDVNGYEVYKNKYCMGLGTTYDKYITEEEFFKYPVEVREQVLMQAAVLPERYHENTEKIGNVKHATTDDIKLKVNEVDYKMEAVKKCEIDPDARQITVFNLAEVVDGKEEKTSGKFNITLPEIKNSQVILAFENFRRQELNYDDTAMLFYGKVPEWKNQSLLAKIRRKSFKDNTGFKITAKISQNGSKKGAKCEAGGVRSFNDIDTYDLNLGYFDTLSGDVTVQISNHGYYTYDAIKVYAIPMDGYEKNAAKLDAASYKIENWDNDYVNGTVNNEEDRILYLSILRNPGWHIYIDGEKAHKIKDVNISFIGAMVPAGSHQVELVYEYPYQRLIFGAMGAGVILMLVLVIRYHVRRRKNKAESAEY